MPFPRRPLLLRTWDLLIGRRTAAVPPKRSPLKLDLLSLEDRVVLARPLPQPFLFTGVGTGLPPLARAYNAETGDLKFEKQPFESGFSGGVRVSAGDLDHDGVPDLIAAAGPGGGPRVVVYSGKTGNQLSGPLGSFYAYASTFTGGVSVASGDVDGDKHADLITAAGAGGAPHVKVWSGATGQLIQSFYAFAPAFRGGATVAASDFTGDGRADLVVGAGPGGGPHVKVFDLSSGQPVAPPLGSFYAFDKTFTGGVDVGTDYLTGDVTGDGRADIAVGRGPGAGSLVRVFDGVSGAVALEFSPFGSGMTAGVRTATAFVDNDKYADIIAATGAGPTATIKVFSGLTGAELASPMSPYTPFGSAFTGGLFVAASNDPEMPGLTVTASASSVAQGGRIEFYFAVDDIDSSNGVQTPTGDVVVSWTATQGGGVQYATLTTVSAGHAVGTVVYDPVTANPDYYGGLYAAYAGDDHFYGNGTATPSFTVTGPPPPPTRPVVTGVSTDTGVSATDELTSDTTLDVFGTADAGSVVSVLAENVTTGAKAAAGTATASGAGTWTVTYGTTLSDGPYRFTATASAGGASSDPSVPLPVLIDTVAPTVSVAFDPGSADTSRRPTVRATARDPNGLGTTATLDIDFNNDGDFADAGETGAATAAVGSGGAAFASYPLLAVGSQARFRVRVPDMAGNEGTSGTITRTPAAVTAPWSPVAPTATGGDDTGTDVAAAGNAAFAVSAGTGLAASDCGCQTDEFVFSQQAADPTVAVRAAVRSDNGSLGLPDQIVATLVWDGSVAATAAYDPAAMAPGEVWHLALAPAVGQSTGRHTYTLHLFVDYAGTANDVTTSVTDAAFVVNGSADPLGAGVGYGGVDKLIPVAASGGLPAGFLRVAADGRWTFYADAGGGTYTSPQGDAGTLAADGGGYKYTSADGRTRAYDSGGKLTVWASRDGHERFTYTYDGSNRLATKQAPDGQRATFSYSTNQVAVEGAGGRRTTLTLSGGKLVGIATPDGGVGTFTYTGGRLTREQAGVLDREWTYAGGRVATESAGGVTRDVVPAAARGEGGTLWGGARTGTVADGAGNVTETAFDGRGRPTYSVKAGGGITVYTRDSQGRVTGVTDELGQATAVTRDAAGRPLTTTAPGGGVVSAVYSGTYGDLTGRTDELGRTVTATYDADGHLLTVTDPLGGVTTYTWTATGQVETATDPTGRVTTYVYDSGRRLVRTISGGISSGTVLYDAAGASAGWTDVFGATTTVLSDGAGRAVATTTPDGATATTVYDPATGLVAGTIAASGVRTSYLYDGAGRRTVVIEGVGSGLEARTTSVYDDAGRLLAEVAATGLRTTYQYDADGNVVAVTDPAGHTTRTVYDVAGRAVASIDALGRTSTTVYDADGRAVASIDPLGNRATTVYDAAGNAVASVDALGNRSTTVFDSSNRPVATVDALGNRATTVYDGQGRAVASIDALGRTSTTVYDARGYAEARVDALGNRSTTVYDDAGRAVASIDALGNRNTTVYDTSGRAVAQVDALGNRSTTIYDQYGRFAASQDPLGNRTTAVYDARDRRVGTLDALGNRTTAVLDAAGRTVASIDALGNVTTTVYDPFGRAVATVDPLGNRTTALYDGRLPGEELTDAYRPASNRSATQDALGEVWSSTADALGRTVSTVDPLGNTSTSVYDAASNLVTSIDALGNRTTTIYDALNRGVARIDALGNRSTSVFDAAGQMVASVDALGNRSTTVYDLAGRAVAFVDALGRTGTAVYDAAGQTVASIDALGNRSTSVYDAAGRVIASVDALGNTTTSVYDAAGNRVATVDALGNRTTTVYDVLNRPVASIDALGNRGTSIYDARGAAVATQDALGNLWTATYDAAGNAVSSTDPLGRTSTTVYDALNRAIASVDALGNRATSVFDAAGNAIASIDPRGNRTTAVYDALNRGVARVDALGNRTTSVFDAAGNAVAMIDALANRSTTVYDALNRAVASIDALGNRATAVFDAAGQMIASVDPLGHRTTSIYDLAGRRVATQDALGRLWTSVYDAAGNAVASVDPLGRTNTTVYDALNRAVASIDALGNRSTSVFDAAGNAIAAIDALGNRTTSVFDQLNRGVARVDALGNRSTSVFDAAGQAVASIDALGRVSTSVYDLAGRLTESIDALGNIATTIYDAAGNAVLRTDPLGRTSLTVYDALNRPVASVDPLENRSTSVYDAAGNLIASIDPLGNRSTTVYDATNRAIASVDALGNRNTTVFDAAGNAVASVNARGFTSTVVFDALNRAVASIDALGNRSTSVYDAAGQTVASIDALGNVSTTTYDARGMAVARTNPLGHTGTTVYDALGRAVNRIDPLGRTSTTAYDVLGRVVNTVDPLGNTTTSAYDAVGNAVASTDARGNVSTTVYDALDRAVARIDALGNRSTSVYDAAGQMVASIDELGFRSTSVYDEAGRMVASIDRLGNYSTTVYDAASRAVASIDQLGRATTAAYDAAGRTVAVTDPRGGVTTSVYDANGNRTVLIDASGNRTTSAFDALDRVTAETDPLNATATTAYDAVGRVSSATDRLGRRIDYAFDAAGRVTGEGWVSGGVTQARNTFAYDAADRRTVAANGAGAYTFTHDAADRVATVAGPFGVVLTFGYDAAGNRTQVQDSAGGVTTSVFDGEGRLTSRQLGGTGVTAERVDWAYTGRGQVGTMTRYSDLAGTTVVARTVTSYDDDGRVTSIVTKDAGGTVLSAITYTLDAVGNITERNDGAAVTFAYDAADQVTGEGSAVTFGYDATGNRTNSGYSTGAGNRTSNDGTWTYTYDTFGAVTKRSKGSSAETWVYGYDFAGRMVTGVRSATDGGAATGRVTYVYDVFGNRVERQAWDGTAATVERFVVDGWDTAKGGAVGSENFDTVLDLDGSNAVVARRLFGAGFDDPVARQVGGAVAWYVADAQGSVRQLLDNSGVVVGTLAYSAFGVATIATGSVDRYRFTGREWDSLLGLQYSRSRIYDPVSGKWLSADTKGFAAGDTNLYRYVGNKVTTGRDPSGYAPIRLPGYEPGPNLNLNGQIGSGALPSVIDSGPAFTNWGALYPTPSLQDRLESPDPEIRRLAIEEWKRWERDAAIYRAQQESDRLKRARVEAWVDGQIRRQKVAEELGTFVQASLVPKLTDFAKSGRVSKETIGELKKDGLVVSDDERFAVYAEATGPSSHRVYVLENQTREVPNKDCPTEWTLGGQPTRWRPMMVNDGSYTLVNVLDRNRRGWTGAELKRYANLLDRERFLTGFRDGMDRVEAVLTGLIPGLNTYDKIGKYMSGQGSLLDVFVAVLDDGSTLLMVGAAFKGAKAGAKLAAGTVGAVEAGLDGSRRAASLLRAGGLVMGTSGAIRLGQGIGELAASGGEEGYWHIGEGLLKLAGGMSVLRQYNRMTADAAKMEERVKLLTAQCGVDVKTCFPEGTLLRTPSGLRPIESLVEGDTVLSRPETDPDGPISEQVITDVMRGSAQLRRLVISGHEMKATPNHPVYVRGRGWVPASLLKVGTRVVTDGDIEGVVEVNELLDGRHAVYNVSVANWHTYFVSGHGWPFAVWVHNDNCIFYEIKNALGGRTHYAVVLTDGPNRGHRFTFATREGAEAFILNPKNIQNTGTPLTVLPGSPLQLTPRYVRDPNWTSTWSAHPPRNVDILTQNMGIGPVATDGRAAHHIVQASNNKDSVFQQARDLLVEHQIDINGTVNGVALQSTKPNARINPGLRRHAGGELHTIVGGQRTLARLDGAVLRAGTDWSARREAILSELSLLRQEILAGTFP